MLRLFYDPRQSASGNDSFSPSAGKPAAFVKAALARFPGRVTAIDGFLPLTADEMALAHNRSHVDAILECRAPNGFGNRLPSVADSLPWTTGSFVAAARAAALNRGAACSPTSGFHHAEFCSSMGFCTFNGLAIAAIILREEGLVKRIGIADFDAHYGNGTADIIERLGLDHVVNHSLGRFIGAFAEPGTADRWLAASTPSWSRGSRAAISSSTRRGLIPMSTIPWVVSFRASNCAYATRRSSVTRGAAGSPSPGTSLAVTRSPCQKSSSCTWLRSRSAFWPSETRTSVRA